MWERHPTPERAGRRVPRDDAGSVGGKNVAARGVVRRGGRDRGSERCAAARGVRPFCKKAWRKTRKTLRRGGNRYVEKTGSPYMGSRENRAPRVMSPEPSPRHPGRSPTQHGRFPRGLPRRSFLPEKYCRRAGCHAHNRAESAHPMHRIPTLRFRSP